MIRILIACLLLVCELGAQITPSAPIANFRLPMFGENGFRSWELSGTQGRYLSDEKIEVDDMKLKIYSGETGMDIEHLIKSPRAILFAQKNIAIGEGPIRITSTRYRITGERWFWDGKTRSVVISKKAAVTFFEEI